MARLRPIPTEKCGPREAAESPWLPPRDATPQQVYSRRPRNECAAQGQANWYGQASQRVVVVVGQGERAIDRRGNFVGRCAAKRYARIGVLIQLPCLRTKPDTVGTKNVVRPRNLLAIRCCAVCVDFATYLHQWPDGVAQRHCRDNNDNQCTDTCVDTKFPHRDSMIVVLPSSCYCLVRMRMRMRRCST